MIFVINGFKIVIYLRIGGDEDENSESANKASTVETVCVVDIRDNNPESTSFPYELDRIEENQNDESKNGGSSKFHPLQLLDKSGRIFS